MDKQKIQMKRLNKYLAECSVDSRRKCDLLIEKGRVQVNGETVRSLGSVIDEKTDHVKVDGRTIKPPNKLVYILLNKPKGYVTTVEDKFHSKKVVDLVPPKERLFPVGRLDKDTTGALLLTNDGDLAFKLMHPKFEITKDYYVVISKPLSQDGFAKLKSGILLEDGYAKPVKILVDPKNRKQINLSLNEGRKREIRRMFRTLGYRITILKRARFAGLSIKGLKPGEWRNLTNQEIKSLMEMGRTS